MTTIEAPGLHHVRGLVGTFALVSVDPVASVAPMQDERATQAASLLRMDQKFLVIVSVPSYHNMSRPMEDQAMRLNFFAVGRGFAPNQSYASIGLFPGAPHPDNRPPLVPSAPLPWPDCYVHTLLGFSATVSRLHTVPPEARTQLTGKQCTSIIISNSEDGARRGAETKAAKRPACQSAEPTVTLPTPAPAVRSASSHGRDTDTTSSGSLTDSTDEYSIGADFYDLFVEPQEMRLHVEVWLDLSSAPEIGSPAELDACFKPLLAIESEWVERISISMPVDPDLPARWAIAVAASGSPDLDAENVTVPKSTALPEKGAVEDDIWPEDAIEHRIKAERRRIRAAKKAERGTGNVGSASNEDTTSKGNSFPKRKLRRTLGIFYWVGRRVQAVVRAVAQRFARAR